MATERIETEVRVVGRRLDAIADAITRLCLPSHPLADGDEARITELHAERDKLEARLAELQAAAAPIPPSSPKPEPKPRKRGPRLLLIPLISAGGDAA